MRHAPAHRQRRSLRLKDYDYAQAGVYFVTICTKDRVCLFGDLVDGEMQLNAAGRVAERYWLDIPVHFPHTELDAFVVMPNHVHGILVIGDAGRGTACRAPTVERFGQPVAGSIPTVVRSFKSAVTKQINLLQGAAGTTVWQRNYYEHIIRDEAALDGIREYIDNNPLQWALDRENPANVGARHAVPLRNVRQTAQQSWEDG